MMPCAMVGAMLLSVMAVAEDEWGADLEIYGWLPILDVELADGSKFKITRDDILSDVDVVGMAAGRLRNGRWSLTSDFIYFDISDKSADFPLLLPGLATLTEGALQAWVVTPNIGYVVLDNDQQKVELYGGARYLWLEAELTFEIDPISPGEPSSSMKTSRSESAWDAIVGARGLYYLPDDWFVVYSANAGAGESDLTWTAQTGLGYSFNSLDAVLGWRYLSYDLGSDTLIKEITFNGPFAGVIFRW